MTALNNSFIDMVKSHIREFNETKGELKELRLEFVKYIPQPYIKYGRRVNLKNRSGKDIQHIVTPNLARALVRTLVRTVSPRPLKIQVNLLSYGHGTEYICRLKVPA